MRDHFVACYVLLESWGNPPHVCLAGLLHAIYQRGDGLRAVDANEMRPKLRKKLGERVENLLYLFPSAHKSAYDRMGLLHAPLGETITVPDVLVEGATLEITPELRKELAELEFVNSHDQNILEITGELGPTVRVRVRVC